MIELAKAIELSGMHLIQPGTEMVSLEEARGRVLMEDICADRDVPPFTRSTMDGYACRQQDLPGPLEVLETIEAGNIPTRKLDKGQCCKIMTGAMIPEGADCVIMKEYVKRAPDDRIIFTADRTERNIDHRGQDLKEGELLLQTGTRITPGHIGIIASAGKIRVKVSKSLQVGIQATGSELIEPEMRPEGAQIRNSNSHQLAAFVRQTGHLPRILGILEDNRKTIADGITEALKEVDLLLLTGGASVGDLDLVPGVLQELGFHLEYDRVAIQPGKPVTFAHRNGDVCFGLSGNPVSSFVQFELLVRPYLESCSGMIPVNRRILIKMEEGYRRNRADRQFFLPVFITETGNCRPVEYHGSGHLHSLDKTTGLAEISAGQKIITKGDLVYVRLI